MSEITEFPTRLNPLPKEQQAEKRAAIRARKAFAEVFSPFVKAMREAVSEYLHFRSKGVSREDGIKGIEAVLRDVWPKRVSKFSAQCDACDDTGFEPHTCQPYARCGSKFCERKGDEHQHTFVRFCQCEKGQAFARNNARKRSGEAALAETIGKVTKPKPSWKRLGL